MTGTSTVSFIVDSSDLAFLHAEAGRLSAGSQGVGQGCRGSPSWGLGCKACMLCMSSPQITGGYGFMGLAWSSRSCTPGGSAAAQQCSLPGNAAADLPSTRTGSSDMIPCITWPWLSHTSFALACVTIVPPQLQV